jgi:hypothetical protein
LDIQINLTWYLETAMESSRRASSRIYKKEIPLANSLPPIIVANS